MGDIMWCLYKSRAGVIQTNEVVCGLGKGRAHLTLYKSLDLAELFNEPMLIVQQNSIPKWRLPVGGHCVPPLQNGVINTLREERREKVMGKKESATLHKAG